MEAPPPGAVCLSCADGMRHHLWIRHCRFECEQGKTGRGWLTGLDVQIKTPVYEGGGWGGAASVSRGKPTSSPCSWGGTGLLCGLLADRVWVWEAEGGSKGVLSILLHRGRPCDRILLIRHRAKPSAGIWESSFMLSFLWPKLKMWGKPGLLLDLLI